MDTEEWIDRDRGVLTKKQRRYLIEDFDPESKTDADRQREYRMRKHLRNVLIDFQLLSNFYTGLFDAVFDDLTDSEKNLFSADRPLRAGVEGVFTLLYHAFVEFEPERGLNDHRFRILLDNGVSEAVEREYAFQGLSVRPAFTGFKVHGTEPAVPLKAIARELEQGGPLYTDEVEHLYWGGWISYETYREHDGLGDLDELREEHGDEHLEVLESLYEERGEKRRQAADEDAPTDPKYGGFVKQSTLDE